MNCTALLAKEKGGGPGGASGIWVELPNVPWDEQSHFGATSSEPAGGGETYQSLVRIAARVPENVDAVSMPLHRFCGLRVAVQHVSPASIGLVRGQFGHRFHSKPGRPDRECSSWDFRDESFRIEPEANNRS